MEHRVYIVRHAKASYPKDALTQEGIAIARQNGHRFDCVNHAVASPKERARHTAIALGFNRYMVDPRLAELELEWVNEPSPRQYVSEAHRRYPDLIQATGELMETAILNTDPSEITLLVSHNLAMSALYRRLAHQIDSFDNLGGMKLRIDNGSINLLGRI